LQACFAYARFDKQKEGEMSKFAGYALLVTGFLACPCHLVLTLPLIAAVFGGAALASFTVGHTELLTAVLAVYFVGALSVGWWLLRRQ
jgi:mercuric ion transport protein